MTDDRGFSALGVADSATNLLLSASLALASPITSLTLPTVINFNRNNVEKKNAHSKCTAELN